MLNSTPKSKGKYNYRIDKGENGTDGITVIDIMNGAGNLIFAYPGY